MGNRPGPRALPEALSTLPLSCTLSLLLVPCTNTWFCPCSSPFPCQKAFGYFFLSSPPKFFLGLIKNGNDKNSCGHYRKDFVTYRLHIPSLVSTATNTPNAKNPQMCIPSLLVCTSNWLLDLSSGMFFKLSMSEMVLILLVSSLPTVSSCNDTDTVTNTQAAPILCELTRSRKEGMGTRIMLMHD